MPCLVHLGTVLCPAASDPEEALGEVPGEVLGEATLEVLSSVLISATSALLCRIDAGGGKRCSALKQRYRKRYNSDT